MNALVVDKQLVLAVLHSLDLDLLILRPERDSQILGDLEALRGEVLLVFAPVSRVHDLIRGHPAGRLDAHLPLR